MINIAICDDDKAICTQIENILLEYAQNVCLKIETSIFYTGETLLDYFNKGNYFDLIFLDIEMEKINGVEVGRKIRKVFKLKTN